MNLLRKWTEPKNDIIFFIISGAVKFEIAAVLVSSGAIPDWVNLWSYHFFSVLAKWQFGKIIVKLSSSNLFRHF